MDERDSARTDTREGLHRKLLDRGDEEVEAFFGEGGDRIDQNGDLGKLEDVLMYVGDKFGEVEGIVVLPTAFVEGSEASKHMVGYAVYVKRVVLEIHKFGY